jgi:hypothetical protein
MVRRTARLLEAHMKKAWLALPVVAVALALVGPAAPSSADTNAFGRCPDHYTPTPFLFSSTEDRNGNGVVCVKQEPNGNVNSHDDPNGQPYQCNGTGALDPNCSVTSVVDDILP